LKCDANDGCPNYDGLPYCDLDLDSPAYGTCIECESDADCPGTVCQTLYGLCGGLDCRADSGLVCAPYFCDPSSGQCVMCETDADCTGKIGTPHCDPFIKSCVCESPTECGLLQPGCALGICSTCSVDADCPPNQICLGVLPFSVGTGGCVCLGSSGCEPPFPVCEGLDAGPGLCGCNSNAQCPNGSCSTAAPPAGMCELFCRTSEDCPDGGTCLLDGGAGLCQPPL
jgi:hypothetical protein